MKHPLLLALVLSLTASASAQDRVMMQGFYWDVHPGGVWYDSLITRAAHLGVAGFDGIWLPPPTKGAASGFDVGYTPYDYYDLGAYDSCGGNNTQGQGGCIPTRYGTRRGLEEAVARLKQHGLEVYADIVLNHRSGGSLEPNQYAQYYTGGGSLYSENGETYTAFPLTHGSGRVAWPVGAGNEYFYPNASNNPDNTFDFYSDAQLAGFHQMYVNSFAYDNALHNGFSANLPLGDSLIVWGDWLTSTLDLDGYRFDFVKGIHPEYLKRWVDAGAMAGKFHVHELYDGNVEHLKTYNTQLSGSIRPPAVFDFNMRFAYKDVLDHGHPVWTWQHSGLMNQFGFPFDRIVTFIDNHDFDRLNFEGQITIDGHSPVVNNKMLAYAHMLTHPGMATVWWRDYYQYGLRPQIDALIRYRDAYASGSFWTLTRPETGSPFWTGNNPANPWDNLYVAQRNGSGGQTGLIVAINKHPTDWAEVYVTQQNGAWTNRTLKDVTGHGGGGTTQIFGDNRVRVWAPPLSYTLWVPTDYSVPGPPPAATPDQPTYYDVDWANLQAPAADAIAEGESASFSARAYVHGVTNKPGQGSGVSVWIGYSTEDSDPASWTNWEPASYTGDAGHLDEYAATLSGLAAGSYFVASRVQFDGKDSHFGGASDPHGGFWDGDAHRSAVLTVGATRSITGGGWFPSPAGAYAADPDASGKAHFSFSAVVGAAAPSGEVSFRFRAGGLEFESTALEQLTISGAEAQLRGSGTIGGSGDYGFLLFAMDGQVASGSKRSDEFGIRIWLKDAEETIIYDGGLILLGGGQIKIHDGTGAAKSGEMSLPSSVTLHQNYPNPFNPSTNIAFDLPHDTHVRLAVFDMTGREIARLVDHVVEAGRHQITWDARSLPSGVYVYRLEAGTAVTTKRLILTK